MLPEKPPNDLADFVRWNLRIHGLSSLLYAHGLSLARLLEYPYAQEKIRAAMGSTDAILDLGSGHSLFPVALSEDQFTVVSADRARASLAEHRKACLTKGLRVPSAVVCEADCLPFRDSAFQAITCISALEHMEDDASVIAECARVLKPGGFLILTVPFTSEPDSYEVRDKGYGIPKWMSRILSPLLPSLFRFFRVDREGTLLVRHYSLNDLTGRLGAPNGLSIEELRVWGKGKFDLIYNTLMPIGFLSPLEILAAKSTSPGDSVEGGDAALMLLQKKESP